MAKAYYTKLTFLFINDFQKSQKISSCLPAVKRGVENGAPRKRFGPSYFVTALEF